MRFVSALRFYWVANTRAILVTVVRPTVVIHIKVKGKRSRFVKLCGHFLPFEAAFFHDPLARLFEGLANAPVTLKQSEFGAKDHTL
jgi:hypothetical protein